MRLFEIASGLQIDIPEISRIPVSPDIEVVNANPMCGQLPFVGAEYYTEESYGNFRAWLDPAFIQAMIVPRGRPHISLIHIAVFDDNIATLSFPVITGETYGREFRYLESGVSVAFHREVFFRSVLQRLPPGAAEADRYSVEWEILPQSDRYPMLQRGIFRGIAKGYNDQNGEIVKIASWEGGFFRRRGVLNIVN